MDEILKSLSPATRGYIEIVQTMASTIGAINRIYEDAIKEMTILWTRTQKKQ